MTELVNGYCEHTGLRGMAERGNTRGCGMLWVVEAVGRGCGGVTWEWDAPLVHFLWKAPCAMSKRLVRDAPAARSALLVVAMQR